MVAPIALMLIPRAGSAVFGGSFSRFWQKCFMVRISDPSVLISGVIQGPR